MLKLERGDEDNLVGKVVVYSTLEFPSKLYKLKNITYLLYASNDKDDFFEKTTISKKQAEKLEKECKKQDKEDFPMFFVFNEQFADKVSFSLADEDLINAGTYFLGELCGRAINAELSLYQIEYYNQQISKSKENKFKNEKTYGDVKENVGAYLLEKYIGPMISAKEKRNHEKFNELKLSLMRFGIKTEIAPEISKAIKMLEQARRKNYSLVWPHIKMISAIQKEDYRTAAEIRDQLKIVEKQNKV